MESAPTTLKLDVNTLDVDGDGQNDRITFHVKQQGDQSVEVKTFVALAKDRFEKCSTTRNVIKVDAMPNWSLSEIKFTKGKLVLRGMSGSDVSEKSIEAETLGLLPSVVNKRPVTKEEVMAELDRAIQENAGVLGALRDGAELDNILGSSALGSELTGGISGLIQTRGTQIGSGGFGFRGSGLGGGGTADGLGGLGTKGRGTGGVRSDGHFEAKAGRDMSVKSGDPVILGSVTRPQMDKCFQTIKPQIQSHYDAALRKNPDLHGRTAIKFVVSKDGNVAKASIKYSTMGNLAFSEELEKAIYDSILQYHFPPLDGGGIAIITLPITFG